LTEYLLILVSTVLANNFVLVRFLGLCPLMGVSGKLEGAIGMSVATLFVLTLSSVSSYLLSTCWCRWASNTCPRWASSWSSPPSCS
jgi:Na+-translocating ferredoxin:NAD+ oxidoreductase subunit A